MPRYFREPAAAWRDEPPADGDSEDPIASIVLYRGQLVSLNVLGTEVWKLCDGRSAEEMVAALLPEFDVAGDELAQDVAAFLESLVAQGLVHAR